MSFRLSPEHRHRLSDASIVYIVRLTMAPPAKLVYHVPRGWDTTACGLPTHSGKPHFRSLVVPVRLDVARMIGRFCQRCARRMDWPIP